MFERIRLHLTAGYVGIFALLLVAFGIVAVIGFSRQVSAQQDELLMQQARNRAESPRYASTEEILVTPDGTQVLWIPAASDDRLWEESTPASSLGLPATEPARRAVRTRTMVAATVAGPQGDVRVVSRPVLRGGELVGVIQAGQPRRVVQETVNRLIFVLVPVGLGALVLAAIGGMFVSSLAMRPVRESFDRQRKFVADASHELKTPLTLIRADAEVLARDLAAPTERDLIGDLVAETERMDRLISDLLLLARLDAGKLAVAHDAFDLSTVLAETAERFRARATAEGVGLEVESSGELTARGDPERTSQILAILIDNALRHTPPEGTVTVVGSSDDRWVEASVADTGPGIPPEHLPRIFDRFYRAEAARTRGGGGSGLGLAIAYDLVRAQDGHITVENPETGGAVFRLKLPRTQ
jgi:signal transduction histidine kinase